MSESSVPAPRPSEPLPCPFCGEIPTIEKGSTPHPAMPTIWPTIYCTNRGCAVHPDVEAKTLTAAITAWNRRSPSVPTAIQEQRAKDWTISDGRIYAKCAYCGGDNERDQSGRVFPWACGHCGKEIILAEPAGASSEEAATSDTERLDWLATKTLEVRDVLRYGSRHVFFASPEEREGEPDRPSNLRKAIDAARVQGENSQ